MRVFAPSAPKITFTTRGVSSNTDPTNANVEIEEMTWRDGDYWIALWLHQVNGQWLVLDLCRWHKNVAF